LKPWERVLAAFEHRPADKVPIYQAGLSSGVASAVLGREAYVGGGIQQWRESRALWNGPDAHQEFLERSIQDPIDLAEALDLDLVRPVYWRMGEKPAKRIDDFSFLYGDPEGDWRVMRFDPETELYQIAERSSRRERTMADLELEVEDAERALENYRPSADSYVATYGPALEAFKNKRAVPGGGIALNINYLEPAWLEAIALRPDLVARIFDVKAEQAARAAGAQAEVGLRYLMGGGDFSSQRGPFYSPAKFHELTLPRLQKISEAVHRNGQFHMFASDGDLWPVADDLFGAAGVDCFYEIDRKAGMDLRKLRRRFPGLTLLGNISSYVLHCGSRDDVIGETTDCLDAAKEFGSIIVGCSNQVVSQTPMENFWAMMETLHEQR
jgi:hypothetical protein